MHAGFCYATYMTTRNQCIMDIEDGVRIYAQAEGYTDIEAIVTTPTDSSYDADVSIHSAFYLAKLKGKRPMEVASDIVDTLKRQRISHIEEIEIAHPGFINIRFSNSFFVETINDIEREKEQFGAQNDLCGQVWAIEHTSPNPNKTMHIGHLRNNIIAMSFIKMCEYGGATVIAEAVNNDRGIAIAKVMYGFLVSMRKDTTTSIDISYWEEHRDKWYTPEEKQMLPDVFVTECYMQGETETKGEKGDTEARKIVMDWEQKDRGTCNLWEHLLAYAYEGQKRTLTRLGNRWDKVWNEHEHYERGKIYIKQGLKSGIFTQLEDGAICTKLDSYNLPNTIVLKKDGTSLYITQDIALTALKKETHHANKFFWVVGIEQTLAFRQLFAVCEQLRIGKQGDFFHISYGYVSLKDGDVYKKMSSRTGTVVLIDDVLNEVRSTIRSRFLKNGREDNKDLEVLSESLAKSAVFFSLLKVERTQDMRFDTQQSIAVSGDSGIYILYSFVRAHSILRAAQKDKMPTLLSTNEEVRNRSLVLFLSQFEEVVIRARRDISPHYIAHYLLKISSEFNSWYTRETILDGSPNQLMKLRIVQAYVQVVNNALLLLNMDPIESM